MFARIPEPELMEDKDQCEYYNQEFIDDPVMLSEFIELYNKYVGIKEGTVVDLGSGTCNFVVALCNKYPQLSFTCYEASKEMIRIARKNIADSNLEHRVKIIEDTLFNAQGQFDIVIANRVLHHINQTNNFWKLVNSLSANVLVCDLERPDSLDYIQESFSNDLKNSFMAAYTVEEVLDQIKDYNYTISKKEHGAGISTYSVFTRKDT